MTTPRPTVKPLERRAGSVQRFLVTAATPVGLDIFDLRVRTFANGIERRGLTVLYTVIDNGSLDHFFKVAKDWDLTVQQRVEHLINGKMEFWALVNAGAAEPWVPKDMRPVPTKEAA